jgi:hypothetical protein
MTEASRTDDRAPGALSRWLEVNRAGSAAIGWQRARFRLDRSLSAGYLGVGFAILGSLLLVRGLASLAWSWNGSPWRWLSVAAWAILLAVLVVVIVTSRRRAGLIAPGMSAVVDVAGVLAVALDVTALVLDTSSRDVDASGVFYPTAIVGFGACLVACLPAQPLSRSAIGGGLLVAAGVATTAVGAVVDPSSIAVSVNNLLIGAAPVFACILMLNAMDARLGELIDQAVTDSLLPAPAAGHGVSAASHLRQLDIEAELLLERVAASAPDSPLDETTAARAGLLGDDLRRALRADHELSWLQIAISESERLRGSVALDDPSGSAKALTQDQRSTLLALIWLLSATRAPGAAPAVHVRVEPASPGDAAAQLVTLSRPGRRTQSIDNAAWPLFTRLGRYTIDVSADRVSVAVYVTP